MGNVGSGTRLALIGFGSVGRRLGDLIRAGSAGYFDVVAVLVRDPGRYAADAERTGWHFTDSFDELLAAAPAVVVEVAGHAALLAYGEAVLGRGITVVTISAGVFGDDAARDRLLAAAEAGHARLVLSSGAIAGLDAIESASFMGLERVRHVVRKPPRSLFDDPAEIEAVMQTGVPRVLYEGPAREATRRFPANVNVVAMVSLAGIGFDRTTVAVVADPNVEHNTHEVTAEGSFGRIDVRVENVPSPDNPKTGLITAGSVARSLRRLRATFTVGG